MNTANEVKPKGVSFFEIMIPVYGIIAINKSDSTRKKRSYLLNILITIFLAILGGISDKHKPIPVPQSSEYKSASSNIVSDVKLYNKNMNGFAYLAEVVCIENNHNFGDGDVEDAVKVHYPSGSIEWKTRDTVRRWYVKSDDPALADRKFYSCE